jgi:hypothetical protein
MLDKCDLEAPRGISFNRDFGRHFNNSANDALFKKSGGGLYLVKADLRGVGIPAMLSLGHKHHPKLGPKFEYLGAGEMCYSDFVGHYEQVFKGDVCEASFLRVDLAGDIPRVKADELGRMMWCKHKHTNQQEYGEWQHKMTTYNRFAAQTLYYGCKPRQLRIYDKTLHRAQVLLRNRHRHEKKHGLPLSTFEEAFGYAATEIVTRVERQMGARETAEKWGIKKFGQIHELVNRDPFENLVFATGDRALEEIDGTRLVLVLMLRERVDREGLDCTRAWLRGQYKGDNAANSFRKFWRENGDFIVVSHPAVTREFLVAEQKRTLIEQLAA